MIPNASGGLPSKNAALWQSIVVYAGLVVPAILVLLPSIGASFLQDDWTFLAIARHLQDPTAFYFADQSMVIYHRPHGMLSWWLLVRAFGLQASSHYAAQIFLHAACAFALFLLLSRLRFDRALAWAGALVFVLHPATVSTASWLSDRFDLMATLGVLLALATAAGPRPTRPTALLGLAMASFLAAGSKETGLLAAPLVALLTVARSDLRWRDRVAMVMAATLPALLWAVSRTALLGTEMGQVAESSLLGDFLKGSSHWLGWLPTAMALDLGRTGAAAAALVACLALLVGFADRRRSGYSRLATGLGLLLAPLLVQWPTTINLGFDDALSHTANLRLFYLASAGFVLLLAIVAEPIDRILPRRNGPALVLAMAAIGLLSPAAYLRSEGLAKITSDPINLAMEASLARSFSELARGAGCKLWYDMPATVNLPGFADHIAKAALPMGHRGLDSLVLSDPMPWQAIVGPKGATPEALYPMQSRTMPNGKEIGRRAVGPLYAVYLKPLDPQDQANRLCAPIRLRWDGKSFVTSD